MGVVWIVPIHVDSSALLATYTERERERGIIADDLTYGTCTYTVVESARNLEILSPFMEVLFP